MVLGGFILSQVHSIVREGECEMAIKNISKDTEIVIRNNVYGGFYYESRTQDFVLDFSEFGDEDRVNFGDLTKNSSRLRKSLNNLNIVVVEVISDDDVTIKDVVERLKVAKSYEKLVALANQELEDAEYIGDDIVKNFIEKCDSSKIESVFKEKNNPLAYTVSEHITEMYKNNELADINKMHVVSRFLEYKNPNDYWNEVEKL